VEILCEEARPGDPVEMSAKSSFAQTPVLGSDKMGLYRSGGDERGVRGGSYTRQVWWFQ